MSQIKTAVALLDAELQFVKTSSDGRNRKDALMIPLTPGGEATRVANSGNICTTTTTLLNAVVVSTGTYTNCSALDLLNYNSVTLVYKVALQEAGKVATVKPRWSIDGTNFYDEPVEVNAATAGTDALGTLLRTVALAGRVVSLALDTTGQGKIERFNRLARYFTVAYAGNATAGTGAKLTLTATPLND